MAETKESKEEEKKQNTEKRKTKTRNIRFGPNGLLSAASAPSMGSMMNLNSTEGSVASAKTEQHPPRPSVPLVPAPIDLRQLRESAMSFRSQFGASVVTGRHFTSDRGQMFIIWDDDSTDDRIVCRLPGIDFARPPTKQALVDMALNKLSSRPELKQHLKTMSSYDIGTVGEEIDYDLLDEKDLMNYFSHCEANGKALQLRIKPSTGHQKVDSPPRGMNYARGKAYRKRAKRMQTITGGPSTGSSSKGVPDEVTGNLQRDDGTDTNVRLSGSRQFQPRVPAGLPPDLVPIFNDKTESLAELEATLQHFKVDASAWKASFGVKTVQNLYEEVCQGTSSLYADVHGVIRVVNLVRVKISSPGRNGYLVENKTIQTPEYQARSVSKLLARKFSLDDGPFLAAMHAMQQELGDHLWGAVREQNVNDSHGNTTVKSWIECMMDHVHPLAFERKSYEESGSNSYPGLRSWYLIDTLLVDLVETEVTSKEKFFTNDALSKLRHHWQWRAKDQINREILNSGPNARRMTQVKDTNSWSVSKNSTMATSPTKGYFRDPTLTDQRSCSIVTRFLDVLSGAENVKGKAVVDQSWQHDDVPPTEEEYPQNFRRHLEHWLRSHGVPTELWGVNTKKTLDDLIQEISKGETELQLVHGQVVRTVRVAKVTVQNKLEKNKLLVETHQSITKSKEPEKKGFKIRHLLLSEKFAPKELPWHAAKRGIIEELLACEQIELGPKYAETSESQQGSNSKPSTPTKPPHHQRQQSHRSIGSPKNEGQEKEPKPAETAGVGQTKRNGKVKRTHVRKFILNKPKQQRKVVQSLNSKGTKKFLAEYEERIHLVDMIPPKIEDNFSPSYPGLLSRYELHNFVVEVDGLPNGDFITEEVKRVEGNPVQCTAHHWKWHTRQEYLAIQSSLIIKVRDYLRLVETAKGEVKDYRKHLQDFVKDAAEKDDCEVIKFLTAEREPEVMSGTVLASPSSAAHQRALSPLIDLRDVVDNVTKLTPLRQAALSNAAHAVEMLVILMLTNGRPVPLSQLVELEEELDDVNQRDDFGCTLIYYAAMVDHAPLVEALLSMEKVAANSVCLQSCIQRRATNVLALLLPRLRHLNGQPRLGDALQDEDRFRPRQRFGPNQAVLRMSTHLGKLQREGRRGPETAEEGRTKEPVRRTEELTVGPSDPNYFENLLVDALQTLQEDRGSGAVGARNASSTDANVRRALGDRGKRKAKKRGGEDPNQFSESLRVYHITRNRLQVIARTLEVVLQNSNPTWPFYRKYLAEYLHAVVEQDNFELESAIISAFIQGSDFPVHVAMTSAHVMREARNLTPRFYEAYHKHETVLQQMVNSILDCCMDQQEAEHVLRERADLYTHGAAGANDYWESEGNMSDQQKYKATCSYLAVKYQLKDVVAHKYFTTQNDDVWFASHDSLYVRWIGWSNRNTGKRMWVVHTLYRTCVTIALLVLLVFMVPLLWVLPFSSYLRHTIDLSRTEFHSCYFRWSSWSISYICFLAAVAYNAFETASDTEEDLFVADKLSRGELVLGFFIVGYVVSVIEQVGMMEFSAFLSHYVNLVDCFSLTCFSIAYILLIVGSRDSFRSHYDILMSLGSLSSVFRLFHLFSASKSLGPLWVAIQFVWWDVVRFACLLSVVIVAFMLALVFLLRGGEVRGFASASQTFTSLMWSIYEPSSSYDDPASQPYQNVLYQVFLFTFLLFAAVLLTNLLIAMMTDRYNAVHQTARKEWRFSLAQLIDRYSNMPIVPAPLNLLIVVPNVVFRIFWPSEPLYDPLDANLLNQSAEAKESVPSRNVHPDSMDRPGLRMSGISTGKLALARLKKGKVYSNLQVATSPNKNVVFPSGADSDRRPVSNVSPYRSRRGVLSKTSFARSFNAAKSFIKSQVMGSPTNKRGENTTIIRTASSFRNRGRAVQDQDHIDYSSRELTLGLAHKRHSVFNNLQYRSTRNLVMKRFRNRCELAEDKKNELTRAIHHLGSDVSAIQSRMRRMNNTIATLSSDSQAIGRTLEALVELGLVAPAASPGPVHQGFFLRTGSIQSTSLMTLGSPISTARANSSSTPTEKDREKNDRTVPHISFTQQSTRRFRDLQGCLPPDEGGEEEASTGRLSYSGAHSYTTGSN